MTDKADSIIERVTELLEDFPGFLVLCKSPDEPLHIIVASDPGELRNEAVKLMGDFPGGIDGLIDSLIADKVAYKGSGLH
jgi:hypothetical protein